MKSSSIRGLLFCIGMGFALTGIHGAIVAGICLMFFATFIPFPLWYYPNPDKTGVGMTRNLKTEITEVEFQNNQVTNVKTK